MGNAMGVLQVVRYRAGTDQALWDMRDCNRTIEQYAPKGVKQLFLGLWPRSHRNQVRVVRGEDVRIAAEKLGMKYMELDQATPEPFNVVLR